ncbi:MAG: rhomboid family intramembrane serine protease [Halobacteriota archaeon]
MARTQCTVCGKQALYRCKYCGDALCKEHLAPEMHWCVAPDKYKRAPEEEETAPMAEPTEKRQKKYDTNLFGIFSHNYAYLLLFLISISFVLQLLIPRYTGQLILIPALVMERPWTLVTYIFLHGNFNHFFFNIIFFVFFAPVLERKIGSTKFLLIFFLSGIVAGIGWSLYTLASNPLIYTMPQEFMPRLLGASGALLGVFGALAVLMPRMRVYFFLLIPLEIWMVVIFFALLDFLMMGSGDMIAHTAHLSGLFFGLLAGLRLRKT